MSELQSENINELASALVECQHALSGAKKDSQNPFFKSRYADLQDCFDALREPLHENGLAVTQTTRIAEQGAVLVTTLMHKSGQWVRGELPLSVAKQNDPQAQGSAITYARRYALSAITGLYQTDDDGEAAQGRSKKQDAPKSQANSSSVGSARTATAATATTKPNATPAAKSNQVVEGEEPQDTQVVKDPVKEAKANPPGEEVFDQILQAGISNGWNEEQVDEWMMGFLENSKVDLSLEDPNEIAKQMTWQMVEAAVNHFLKNKPQ